MRLVNRLLASVTIGCLLASGRWEIDPADLGDTTLPGQAAWQQATGAGAPRPDPQSSSTTEVARWIATLEPAEADALVKDFPGVVGNLDGVPPALRFAANRDQANAQEAIPAGRQLLGYDPRGRGMVTEVFGALSKADRIIVVIPGSDVDLGHYEGPNKLRPMAQSVFSEANRQRPGSVAVIAWAGYETPVGVGAHAARSEYAQAGADRLLRLLEGLAPHVDAEFSMLCHSYGSIVCARAAPGLTEIGTEVSDIVVFGSPGMDVDTADQLDTSARVWAARAEADWIKWIPSIRVFGFGHRTDPTDPAFGARTVAVDDAQGHDGYLVAGTSSLSRLTGAAMGTETRTESVRVGFGS